MFRSSLQLLSDPLHTLRKTRRHIITVHRSTGQVPLFLWDFNETCIFSTDFGKSITFHENPFSVSRVVPRGRRTDGHTWRNWQSFFFHNFAKAPNKDWRMCPHCYASPHSIHIYVRTVRHFSGKRCKPFGGGIKQRMLCNIPATSYCYKSHTKSFSDTQLSNIRNLPYSRQVKHNHVYCDG